MYSFTRDRSIRHISNLLVLACSMLKIAICATESQHERLDLVMIGDETRGESTVSRTRHVKPLLVPARSTLRSTIDVQRSHSTSVSLSRSRKAKHRRKKSTLSNPVCRYYASCLSYRLVLSVSPSCSLREMRRPVRPVGVVPS